MQDVGFEPTRFSTPRISEGETPFLLREITSTWPLNRLGNLACPFGRTGSWKITCLVLELL